MGKTTNNRFFYKYNSHIRPSTSSYVADRNEEKNREKGEKDKKKEEKKNMDAPRHMYFGNPGAGKSTLANCIAGEVLFKAGLGHGEGLTKEMQEKRDQQGRWHVDLPGISDAHNREESAQVCTKALQKGGPSKIFLVFTEQHCRIRPEDRTTMKLILRAAPEIKDQYTIIINQCGPGLMGKITDAKWKKQFEYILFRDVANISSAAVVYLPRVDSLDGQSDALHDLSEDARDALEKAPVVHLTPEKVHPISPKEYETLLQEAEIARAEIDKLRQFEKRFQKEQEEKAEKARREEGLAKRNRSWVVVAASVLAAFFVVCWVFGLFELKKDVPNVIGKTIRVDILTSIFLSLFTLYQIYDARKKSLSSPDKENDQFKVLGQQFFMCCTEQYLLVWHIWVVTQEIDALADCITLRSFLLHGQRTWITCTWGATTFGALAIPMLYLRGRICLDTAVVFSLGEDLIQAFCCLYALFESSNDTVNSGVIFSCLLALLGCIRGLADVIRRLRKAEPVLPHFSDNGAHLHAAPASMGRPQPTTPTSDDGDDGVLS